MIRYEILRLILYGYDLEKIIDRKKILLSNEVGKHCGVCYYKKRGKIISPSNFNCAYIGEQIINYTYKITKDKYTYDGCAHYFNALYDELIKLKLIKKE